MSGNGLLTVGPPGSGRPVLGQRVGAALGRNGGVDRRLLLSSASKTDGVGAALGRVAVELRNSYPVLAEEFDITRRQAELRSLEHALDQLADRVRLAPATPTPDGRYVTPHTIDPFTVPIEQTADLLIRANAEAMKVPGVKFVNSNVFFVKEEKSYANTEGTFTTQTVWTQ